MEKNAVIMIHISKFPNILPTSYLYSSIIIIFFQNDQLASLAEKY